MSKQIDSQIKLFLAAIEPNSQADFWTYLDEALNFCDEFMDGINLSEHRKFPEILAFMGWVASFDEALEDYYQSLITEVENAGNEKN